MCNVCIDLTPSIRKRTSVHYTSKVVHESQQTLFSWYGPGPVPPSSLVYGTEDQPGTTTFPPLSPVTVSFTPERPTSNVQFVVRGHEISYYNYVSFRRHLGTSSVIRTPFQSEVLKQFSTLVGSG